MPAYWRDSSTVGQIWNSDNAASFWVVQVLNKFQTLDSQTTLRSYFEIGIEPGRKFEGSGSGTRCLKPSVVRVRMYETSKNVSSGHFWPKISRCSFLHWGNEVRQFFDDKMSSDKLGTLWRISDKVLLKASNTPQDTVPMFRSPEKSSLGVYYISKFLIVYSPLFSRWNFFVYKQSYWLFKIKVT